MVGVVAVESATTVSLCICGVIRLMCCAAGEWELRLSPWRLRRVSVIRVPLLLNWVGMVCDSDMTPPRRVQVAFESFIGELGELTEMLQSGGWSYVCEFLAESVLDIDGSRSWVRAAFRATVAFWRRPRAATTGCQG